jgi:hypothetical protein
MNNILMVGDSHVGHLIDYFREYEKEHTLVRRSKEIKLDNSTKVRVDRILSFINKEQSVSLVKDWGSAYNIDFSIIDDLSLFNNKQSNCFFWLGDNDINRRFLQPGFEDDNIEEVVFVYVNKIIKIFDKTNIHFIYPLRHPISYNHEEYMKVHNLFCATLKNMCADLGLNEPIDPHEIIPGGLQTIDGYQSDLHHLHDETYYLLFKRIMEKLDIKYN